MSAPGDGRDASRRFLEATSRGARHLTSARSVVRVCQRAIRSDDWGALEVSVSRDGGVTVRVERKTLTTTNPLGRPNSADEPQRPSGSDMRKHRLTRKERKALQCQRHGILSRFILGGSTALLARRVVRRAWSRMFGTADQVVADESSSAATPTTTSTITAATPPPMEVDPSPAQARPASPLPALGHAAQSPARKDGSSSKRTQQSPAKGKKSGRRS